MKKLLLSLLLLRGAAVQASDADVARFYDIGKIATPAGVDPQIGGLAVLPDGRLVAAFHHGEIAFYDAKKNTWKIFAEGLHEPLGVFPAKDGSLLVMQRPELTRLRDTDGDGTADRYETVWDGFGMSGNYHEFAFGPVRSPAGKLYVALNLASNGDTVREEIRNEWSPIGLSREKFYAGDWKKYAQESGRMYGRVKWRGWVIEIDEATGAATPFASGFRSPDGLGFDPAGNFIVADNQGDWRGTSELHYVKRDGFYGHPASLVWRKDWDGSEPLKLPVERLNALRSQPAIEIPYASYANSPTQMIVIPKSAAWGPFGGQLVIGEMNTARLLRLLPENVDGVWQGACVMFVESAALKGGLHRLAFIGDTLYVGRTHLSWAGGEGIGTVRPTKTPFDPLAMHVTPTGFKIEFTAPLAAEAADLARWAGQRYYYEYHPAYGSPQMDLTPVAPTKITLSADRRSVEIELAEMKTGYVYDFDLSGLASAEGDAVLNPHIAYTLNHVPGTK